MDEILKIEQLSVSFPVYGGAVKAVRGVSFHMNQGEILAMVGESGCGKSVTAKTILGLLPSPPAQITADCLQVAGVDIQIATEKEMETVRGGLAGMVFQDPMTCLNPTMKIGRQITERLYRRGILSAAECRREAVRLLELVQIQEPELRAEQYPHQFSGGMRQRAMLAMALACKPKLLIADEPTTALDATVQLQLLVLLKQIQKQTGTAILLITHDFSVVANLADRVAVMYAGQIVETGSVRQIFHHPAHPYTRGLLASIPVPGQTGELPFIPGAPPDLFAPPPGCGFAPRCSQAVEACHRQMPVATAAAEGHVANCIRLYPGFLEGEEL